jgi:hypothetical protein
MNNVQNCHSRVLGLLVRKEDEMDRECSMYGKEKNMYV